LWLVIRLSRRLRPAACPRNTVCQDGRRSCEPGFENVTGFCMRREAADMSDEIRDRVICEWIRTMDKLAAAFPNLTNDALLDALEFWGFAVNGNVVIVPVDDWICCFLILASLGLSLASFLSMMLQE
jgi:hypothetical protein